MTTLVNKPIFFYGQHKEYPEFSNFYPAIIEINGRQYATVEHYFQACKAQNHKSHEQIRRAVSAARAKQLGRQVELRRDWEQVKIEVMRQALLAKFTQYEDLRQLLLSTGDRVIHEDSPTDAVWGWMGGRGQDLLGKLMMQVRTALKKGQPT